MVHWYDPGQLLSTGFEVLVSAAMGRRFDYRLMEDVAAPQEVFRYTRYKQAERQELWFDYLADTGDGWRSTHAVASLVAQPDLKVGDRALPRGRFLILGGDEVYPAASQQNYRERLVAPFAAALGRENRLHPPHVFAVPGNHDWYDGLVSFSRLFTQRRRIGGWFTRQRRSYFALKLPHRWWLWAVDVQLESDIDFGQRHYFKEIARQLRKGDRVILLTAEPDWLYRDIREPVHESNLAYLEDRIIAPRGATVYLWLSGDLHHYRRHQHAKDARLQRIVSGGGGAYLSPTHQPLLAPDTTILSRAIKVGKDRFEQQCAYPGPATSARLSLLNALFLSKNWTFGLLTGTAYAALTWGQTPDRPPWEKLPALTELLSHPSRLVWIALVLAGFIFFADKYSPLFRWIGGFLHGCVHVAAALLIAYWTAMPLIRDVSLGPLWQLLLNFLGGAVLGPTILGLYLLIAVNLFGAHSDHAFASLRIQHFKHFLRLHITDDGTLEIFPIAINKVPRENDAHAHYMLIEGPITIRP